MDTEHTLKSNVHGSCKLCFQPIPQAKPSRALFAGSPVLQKRQLQIPISNPHLYRVAWQMDESSQDVSLFLLKPPCSQTGWEKPILMLEQPHHAVSMYCPKAPYHTLPKV